MIPIWVSPFFLEVGARELQIRLANYDRLGLPTDCSSGRMTRAQRQFVGIEGEIALRLYFGDPPFHPWSKTGLDGGRDYLYRGRSLNIMTSSHPAHIHNLCYYPDFKPLKADLIVQARLDTRTPKGHTVYLLTYLPRQRFLQLQQRRPVGPKSYWSVLLSEMHPFEELLAREFKLPGRFRLATPQRQQHQQQEPRFARVPTC